MNRQSFDFDLLGFDSDFAGAAGLLSLVVAGLEDSESFLAACL